MFSWAKSTDIRALSQKYGPLAGYDNWLDGWSIGAARRMVEDLDSRTILIHGSPRTERFEKLWLDLSDRSAEAPKPGLFDAVIVMQMAGAPDLNKIDPANAFAFLRELNEASSNVKPGGYLLWCQYVEFPDDHNDLVGPLDAPAVYQSLLHRGYQSAVNDIWGPPLISIYNHADTVYLSQAATLSFRDRHCRISKALCALRRPA